MQHAPKQKLQCLQVYRAIAALLVLFYHLTDISAKRFGYSFLGGFFDFGYTGVDLFFVLSGFIIFYVHNLDIGEPGRFLSYLKKRFVRIYPIYWIIASAKLVSLLALPAMTDSSGSGLRYLIDSFLLLPQPLLPIIGAAWTLSYELLFYLLFGMAIAFGWRWAVWGMGLWTAAIIAHTIGVYSGLLAHENFLTGFFLNERNLEFLFGCLVAYIVMRHSFGRAQFLILAGAAYYLISGLIVNTHSGEPPMTFALTFGLASALLVAGSVSLEMRTPIAWPKPLVFLGDASYSLYLTHMLFVNVWFIVLARLGLLGVLGPPITILVIAALAILCSCVTYVCVERPVTAWFKNILLKQRAPKQPFFPIPTS